MREFDIPTSVCVHTVHFFPEGVHEGKEEELRRECQALWDVGLVNTAYFNPTISTKYSSLYKHAEENNAFIMDPSTNEPYRFEYKGAGPDFFYVSQLDFTTATAVQLFRDKFKELVQIGFRGMMYDYGEYTPYDAMMQDGRRGNQVHNEYSLLYQNAAFEYFTSLPDPSLE